MRRALPLLLPPAWMAVLWQLSATPADPAAAPWVALPPWVQNAAHVPLYAVLALAWYRALRGFASPRTAASLAAPAAIAYGVVDEWHQAYVPGREASAVDLVLDAAGALLAVAAVFGLRWLRRHRESRPSAAPVRPPAARPTGAAAP